MSGVRVLFQVAVVLVRRVMGRGDQREECDGQMETLERLRGVKDYLQQEDADAFIQEVCSVSLSEKDLQRRTEKQLDHWRQERPDSTFDPCVRCHGYTMAWEKVKAMEEKKEKNEKEKGNLSLPLYRSASSLWRKQGSKVPEDSEGSAEGEQRLSHRDGGQEKAARRYSSNDSTSSMEGSQRNKERRKEGGHFRTSSVGSMAVAGGSAQAQTHTRIEVTQSKPSDRIAGVALSEEGISESNGKLQGDCQERVPTDQSNHKEEGEQLEGRPEKEVQTGQDSRQVEETTQAEEGKQQGGDMQTETTSTEVDNDAAIQILTDKEEKEIMIVEEKEVVQIVKDKQEKGEIQIEEDKLEKETQTVKVKEDEETRMVINKQVEAIEIAKIRPEEGMPTVKDVQQEEETAVTAESLKHKQETTQPLVGQPEDRHDDMSAETLKVQASVDQEDGEGQAGQGPEKGEAQTSLGQSGEVRPTEEEDVVTQSEMTCNDDVHTLGGKQEEGVHARSSSSSRREEEEEGQQLDEDVEEEKKGDEDVEETNASLPGQDTQLQDSECSHIVTHQDDLTFDLVPSQPQSSPDTDRCSATENPQTDDMGPFVQMHDQDIHRSVVVDRHTETSTAAKPTVEDQDQPQETDVTTEAETTTPEAEAEDALEEHPECRGQEMREHAAAMDEGSGNLQEEASVNASEITHAQEIGVSFPPRPQSPTDPSDKSPQSWAANSEVEPTEQTEQLRTCPQSTSSTTQSTETDALQQQQEITEINADNQLASAEHPLSQLENTAHAVETEEDQPDTAIPSEEIEVRQEGEICEEKQVKKRTSDPVVLSQGCPDETDLQTELMGERDKMEEIIAEKTKEHSGTPMETLSPLSRTESGSVASLSGAEGSYIPSASEAIAGGIKGAKAQTPPPGQVRVRRHSTSRTSYPRALSEDIFKDPKDMALQDHTPPQPQAPMQTDEPPATPTPKTAASHSTDSSHKQGTIETPKHTHSPSKSQTLNLAHLGGLGTDTPKRLGLFKRLRGGPKSGGSPKMTIPKILIQDFSEDAEEEAKLSSKERRTRRRERERREKEEEKLRKKRERDGERAGQGAQKAPDAREKFSAAEQHVKSQRRYC